MWTYENRPGLSGKPLAQWTSVPQHAGKSPHPTLLVVAHPRCPCTRATIEELARVMTAAPAGLEGRVYFYKPTGTPDAWSHTGLWRSAAMIPGVQVSVDEESQMARSFGAVTSGQTFLYGADGQLLFSGGLTDSRGHAGESVGGRAILALLSKPQAKAVTTPVFGCSLTVPTRASSTPPSDQFRKAP
jgi:hypothetical protein